jgi:hypothetical protein
MATSGLHTGENHHKAKLSDREVELLRLMRERDGWSYARLAKAFEVTKACVQLICKYRRR